ncbi:alpha-L-fucosidase [Bacteroidota bacterium]
MNYHRNFLFLCLVALSTVMLAQHPGGGNLNPGLVADEGAVERFQDMRIGLSIHWGPSSLGGKEIGWSRDKEIPKEIYDNFYTSFNPVNFDAEEWIQLALDGGMKYISLTSKHHDGFCLWPSDYTDYDIENTPFSRDVVGELSRACKEAGVVFGSYYSIIDWYHYDYQPYSHGGPGELSMNHGREADFDTYNKYMKNQLEELVLKYDGEFIQFDGEWEPNWNHERGSDLYRYMRGLREDILINNRVDVGRHHLNTETGLWDWSIYAGDFEERERMVEWVGHETTVYGRSEIPWQAWVTIDKAQWSYNPTPKLLTAEEVILDLVKTIGDNGNYLINLGPRPDGTFHPEQVEIIQKVGAWIKEHECAIYDTRGGPFYKEGEYTSTIIGNIVYLFVFDTGKKDITFSPGAYTIENLKLFNGATVDYSAGEGICTISMETVLQHFITVYKITMKKSD